MGQPKKSILKRPAPAPTMEPTTTQGVSPSSRSRSVRRTEVHPPREPNDNIRRRSSSVPISTEGVATPEVDDWREEAHTTPPSPRTRAQSPGPHRMAGPHQPRERERGSPLRERATPPRRPSTSPHSMASLPPDRDKPHITGVGDRTEDSEPNPPPGFKKGHRRVHVARHLLVPGEETEGLNTIIKMDIQGYQFEAVIDTGADAIIISHELASCLKFDYEMAEEVEIFNAEAGIRGMKGYDWPDFKFALGSHIYAARAVVAPIIDHMLLGNNFITKYEVTLCNKKPNPKLKVNGEQFPIYHEKRTRRSDILFPVRVARTTRIKPRTCQLVKVKIQSRPEQVELAEGCALTPTLRHSQLLIPNGLLNVSGTGYIMVRNHSDHAAFLKEDRIVGHGQRAFVLPAQRNTMKEDLSGSGMMVRKVTALREDGSPVYDQTRADRKPGEEEPPPPPDVMEKYVHIPPESDDEGYVTEDQPNQEPEPSQDEPAADGANPSVDNPPDTAQAGADAAQGASEQAGSAQPRFVDGLPEEHPYYVSMEQIQKMRRTDVPDLETAKMIEDTPYEFLEPEVVFTHTGQLPKWLHGTFASGCRHLTYEQMTAFRQLLYMFQDVFSMHDQDLGCFKGLKHSINTGTADPVTSGVRRTPMGLEKEEQEQLRKMSGMGVIQPSSSDWSSAPVMVKKKDGSIRYCIDFRKLNEVTVKDQFPLPLITECIDSLAGTAFFSALDLSWGYWQIELSPEDRHKTAFTTKHGLFEHTRMPFGLCNAPSTFMRAMTLVLKGMSWEEVLAYLDDVIVTGKGFDGHLENLHKVLQRLRWHNLKLKPRKCEFFKTQVNYLGRVVTRDGVKVDPAKVETVKNWPVPKSANDIQVFMGLIGYHREFVKKLADIAEPLYKLMKPKAKFVWDADCQKSFEELRTVLETAPVLAYPDPKLPFILDVDASNVGIGAELIQVVDGVERVVAYASNRLTPAQRNYCTTRRELLAVVKYTNQFKHYLLGRPFDIRTDHSSLVWLTRFKHPEGQLARWLEELSQYNMKLVHRKGAKHCNADALSRRPEEEPFCKHFRSGIDVQQLPCGGCKYCTRCHLQWDRFNEDVDDVEPVIIRSLTSNWFPQYSPKEVRQKQLEDPTLAPILEWLEEGAPSALEISMAEPHVRQLWSNQKRLELHQDVLFYRTEQDGATPPRTLLLVPDSMKKEVLDNCHDHMCSGHMGRDKTFTKCRRQFYWIGQFRDIAEYVAACRVCMFAKKTARAPKAAQVAYQAGMPMERVQLDILGPFKPTTPRGNEYILMMIDQFTRWFECAPLKDVKAETIADTAVEQFFCRFGFPAELHTDQGKNVDGNVIRAMCEKLGIKKTRTTPYHPASNGEIERQNRTLLCLIRAYAYDKPADWDRYLPYLAGAMRSAVNKSTGETANRMMLGREVATPTHLSLGLVLPEDPAPTDATKYAEQLTKTLAEVHRHVRLRLKTNILKQKRDADIRLNIKTYLPGDIVYRLEKANKRGVSPKLRNQVRGPYVVYAQTGAVTYQLLDRRRNSTRVHHDMLLPGQVRDVPAWAERLSKRVIQAPGPKVFIPGFEKVYSLKEIFAERPEPEQPAEMAPTTMDKDPETNQLPVEPTEMVEEMELGELVTPEEDWPEVDGDDLDSSIPEENSWPLTEEEKAAGGNGDDPYDLCGLDNLHNAGAQPDPGLPQVDVHQRDFIITDQLAEEIRDPNFFCGLNPAARVADGEKEIRSDSDYETPLPETTAGSVKKALVENAVEPDRNSNRRTRSGRMVHPNRHSDYVY